MADRIGGEIVRTINCPVRIDNVKKLLFKRILIKWLSYKLEFSEF
jgi:hypothetical protein